MKRRKLGCLAVVGLGVLGGGLFTGRLRLPNPKLGPALVATATIAHPEVDEASGLVQSKADPKRFWLHNDSGDWPRIFATTLDGEVIIPQSMRDQGAVARAPKAGETLYPGIAVKGATLIDWEDITRCGSRLYISEMGNNLNARRDLGVYEVEEPDPELVSEVTASFIPVRYPDQDSFPPLDAWSFDCEATFCWRDKLYFLTKQRPAFRLWVAGDSTVLYRLDTMETARVNTLTRVDDAHDLGGWVTSADVSADGRFLAVLIESPVQSIWLYERPGGGGDHFLSEAASVKRFIFHGAGQAESLAFAHQDGGDEIVVVNEQRKIFRISLDNFTAVTVSSGGKALFQPKSGE